MSVVLDAANVALQGGEGPLPAAHRRPALTLLRLLALIHHCNSTLPAAVAAAGGRAAGAEHQHLPGFGRCGDYAHAGPGLGAGSLSRGRPCSAVISLGEAGALA